MLNYLIKESSVPDSRKLLILIHGFGADEHDLFGLAQFFPEDYTVVSIQGQFQMDFGIGRHWYNIVWTNEIKEVDLDQGKDSRNKIIEFIKAAPEKFDVDADKISLLGFSQGSILSYSIILEHPELIDKLIACSGYIDPRLFKFADAKKLKNLKIFASHGIFDEVIPLDQARESMDMLKEKGVEVDYKQYNIAHGISEDVLKDFMGWFNG